MYFNNTVEALISPLCGIGNLIISASCFLWFQSSLMSSITVRVINRKFNIVWMKITIIIFTCFGFKIIYYQSEYIKKYT